QYRPEIDGLRAISVVAVILWHADVSAFAGGFVGVDEFFVISGYLITSIIRAGLSAGQFSFANFYLRRARRILPALFLVCMASLPFAWLWLLPEQLTDFSRSLAAASLSLSNVYFWATSGYFDVVTALKPLVHTWSLSVEEQYYLLFPAFLWGCWKWARGWTIPLLTVAVIVSFALADYGAQRGASSAYYLLPGRGWELGLGALLAMAPDFRSRLPQILRVIFSAAGLGAIVAAVFLFDKSTPFPGRYALIPAGGAALLMGTIGPADRLCRLLGSRPLVAIGLMSYSLYIWHQPVLAFARQRMFQDPQGMALVALLLLTAALSYASWRWIEKPCRESGIVPTRRLLTACAGMTVVLVCAGGWTAWRQGYPARFPADTQTAVQRQIPTHDNGWCFYSVDTDASLQLGEAGQRCMLGAPTAGRTVLLFGDSFAGQYEPLWDALGKHYGFRVQSVTTDWCSPALNSTFIGPRSSRAYTQCQLNRAYLREHIQDFDAVVLGGAWILVQEHGFMPATVDLAQWLAAAGKRTVIMPSPPAYDGNLNYSFSLAAKIGRPLDPSALPSKAGARAIAADSALQGAVRGLPGIHFVPREAVFDPAIGHGHLTAKGEPYTSDGMHISIYGSTELGRQLLASGKSDELIRALLGHATVVAP
ncbi:MAG: acyltransferase family protein, partial [Steroidobacteraceae bacterium]